MKLHELMFTVGNAEWIDLIEALGIVGAGILIIFAFRKIIFPIMLRLAHVSQLDLNGRIISSIKLPVTLGILILSGYLAIAMALDLSSDSLKSVNHTVGILGLALGVITVALITSTAFSWYIEIVAPRTQSTLDDQLMPLIRRIVVVTIYALGGLIILDQLDISISPLIAGLGLGGLAVALAIQPTLANVFAGTYVLAEGVIKPGDYIELEGGETGGSVLDVGWRSTRIRTWTNNLVVIPNSRFAETIITNYAEPHSGVNVAVYCGVSYETNLTHLERVCQEVMDMVIHDSPNANEKWGGFFGIKSFDDSNITFWLFVQANDRLSSFSLKTTLMQNLHDRLNNEGIVINYPVRTLQWAPSTDAPVFLAR